MDIASGYRWRNTLRYSALRTRSQACDVGAPVAEFGNVLVPAFSERAGIEDAVGGAAARKPDRATIQARRLAFLDAPPDVVAHAIELARDRHPAGLDLEHAGMDIADGVEPIDRRGA